MSDDIDAQMAALMARDETGNEDPSLAGDASDGLEGDSEAGDGASEPEWTPPTREHWENAQKALREERDRRRADSARARLYEENIAKMQERFAAFEAQQMAQRLHQPAPDPYENPEAARAWQEQQITQLQRLFAAEQQRQARIVQHQQQEVFLSRLNEAVDDYETEFKASNPDYDDATDYMIQAQRTLLEQAGYPPQVAEQQVLAWTVSVAQQALASGKNPAAWAYENAKRLGYQPKGSGVEAASQRLQAMRAGQAASQTLSGGGATKTSQPTLKQIASLDGDAFDKAMDEFLTRAKRG